MKKKIAIGKDVNIAMVGVIICLISLVILFSTDSVLSFLSKGILLAFGFVGFWILVPAIFILGFYLILRRQLMKVRFDIALWGVFLIIVAFLILSSSWGSERYSLSYNEINYVVSMYNKGENIIKLDFGSPSCIEIFNDIYKNTGLSISNVKLGGGYVGYVFCGALNSAITPIGTTIVSWVFVVGGILLIFNRQIKKLFVYLSSGKQRKAARDDLYSNNENDEYVSSNSIETFDDNHSKNANPNIDEVKNNPVYSRDDLSMRNFNNTHGLQKPTFTMDGEVISNVNNNDNVVHEQEFISSHNASINSSIPKEESKQVVSEMPSFKFDNEINFNDYSDQNDVSNEVNIPQQEDYLEEEPTKNEEFSFENSLIKEEIKEENTKIEQEIKPTVQENEIKVENPKPIIQNVNKVKEEKKIVQPKATIKPMFVLPDTSLLEYHENDDDITKNDASTEEKTAIINETFANMNVGAEVVGHTIGPSVTRFDIKTKPNVLISTITKVLDNLAVNLNGCNIRFEKIVRGKPTSGLELPNDTRTNVGLREALEAMPNTEKTCMNIPFGKSISGDVVSCDIRKMPHLLVAGGTGSGKSIFMHSTILALIMRNPPEKLRLFLIDPKKVEMNYYENIPHLICPNVSEPKESLVALKKLVDEMERRYTLFREYHVRDIGEFNIKAKETGIETIPYIVTFIDEYADLNESCKEIREPVLRLASKARAAGIHLVLATQRPTVNVIDGVIKANLPSRVALKVSSYVDSMTILDEGGAEKLLGNGDMIIVIPSIDNSRPRVQGCFVTGNEIDRVCEYLRSMGKPQYYPQFLDLVDHSEEVITNKKDGSVDLAALKEASDEQLLNTIKNDIMSKEYCSISFIQRTYGVGFPKAGRMFNKLVELGYVSATGDSRGSKVLIHSAPTEGVNSSDASKLYVDEEK